MKVLVTGCAGFIGSHITDALLALGHEVVGVDDFSNGDERNIANCLEHPRNFRLLRLDVALLRPTDLEGVEAICHQAATGSVPRSIERPVPTVQNNVMGFAKVLELARTCGIKRLVFASSSSIHGLNGHALSPYAMTKQMNELHAEQYWRTYGVETIGLRYFNVYGERQRADSTYAAVIPKWRHAVNEGLPVTIYGNGMQSRDFTYIKDVVRANITALSTSNQDCFGTAFDIGTGHSEILNYVACLLMEKMGKSVPVDRTAPRDGDIGYSCAAVMRTQKVLEWHAQYNLDRGLADFIRQRAT